MWRVARVRLFVSLLHWVRVFHMVFHGPCVRPHLLDSRLIFSACLSPLLVCLLFSSSPRLSPLLFLPSSVSPACLPPLLPLPMSVFSACLPSLLARPLAAATLQQCDGSERDSEGAAQRRRVGAVRPRDAPPVLLAGRQRRQRAGSTQRPAPCCLATSPRRCFFGALMVH